MTIGRFFNWGSATLIGAMLFACSFLSGCYAVPVSESGNVAEAPPPPRQEVGYVAEAPPPPRQEVIGAKPGPRYVWMPGYWTWQNQWVWTSGYWARQPHPRAVWVRGHWRPHRGGYMWVPGHWR